MPSYIVNAAMRAGAKVLCRVCGAITPMITPNNTKTCGSRACKLAWARSYKDRLRGKSAA